MAKIRIQPGKIGQGTIRMAVSAVVMSVALSACESVPDAINPVSWYDKTTDFFSGDEQAAGTTAPAQETTAQNQGLSADPDAPPPAPAPAQEVAEASGGLSADQSQQGNYASPPIARQGEASNVLSTTPDAPTPPVPTAQPVSPVTPVAPTVSSAAPAPLSTSAQPPAVPSMPGAPMLTPPSEAEMASAFPEPPKPFEFPPVTAANAYGPDDFETVVITADGMESAAPMRPQQPVQQAQEVAEAPSGALFPEPGTTTSGSVGSDMVAGMLRVATINFANNSASLDQRDRSILGAVIQLQRERGGRVVVIGHASSRTKDMDYIKHQMVNFEISMQRASTIGAQLQSMGLDENALEIQAVADSQPLYLEVMPSGEAGNRRVEIYLADATT